MLNEKSTSSLANLSALRCYACTYVASQQSDTTCIDNPEEVTGQNIVNCDKKYCTILRQELLDPAGKVESFQRSCEDSPLVMDIPTILIGFCLLSFYHSCFGTLCQILIVVSMVSMYYNLN